MCSAPHDRLHFLLSLASTEHTLEVNYSRSVAGTYTILASLVAKEQRLSSLFSHCSATYRIRPELFPAVTSRVPDLRKDPWTNDNRRDEEWRENGGEARCQATCSLDGILSITLYPTGVLHQPITKYDDEYRVNAHDIAASKDLGMAMIQVEFQDRPTEDLANHVHNIRRSVRSAVTAALSSHSRCFV